MLHKTFCAKHTNSFVGLGTMEDMALVAKDVAGLQVAVSKITEIEEYYLSGEITSRQLEELVSAARYSADWANNAIITLKSVKSKAQEYMRELT